MAKKLCTLTDWVLCFLLTASGRQARSRRGRSLTSDVSRWERERRSGRLSELALQLDGKQGKEREAGNDQDGVFENCKAQTA